MMSVEFRMKLQNAVQFLSAHRAGFVPKRNSVSAPTHMRQEFGDDDKLMIANPCTWEQHSATNEKEQGSEYGNCGSFPAATSCPRLANRTRNISRPFAIGPIFREPLQSALQAADGQIGAALKRAELLAVIESAGADGCQRDAFNLSVSMCDR
jgi:hypothetical protein